MENYNGWKNRSTWNVALWLGNDEGLYNMALDYAKRKTNPPYNGFVNSHFDKAEKTPDGILWHSRLICRKEMNEFMRELTA